MRRMALLITKMLLYPVLFSTTELLPNVLSNWHNRHRYRVTELRFGEQVRQEIFTRLNRLIADSNDDITTGRDRLVVHDSTVSRALEDLRGRCSANGVYHIDTLSYVEIIHLGERLGERDALILALLDEGGQICLTNYTSIANPFSPPPA